VGSWWLEEFVQHPWSVRGSARGWMVGALAMALVGCGGGGGSGGTGDPGGGGGGPDPGLSLAAKGAFSADDVGHLLNRTRFSPTAADLARVQAMGVPAFIDAMLVLPAGSAVETAATTSEIGDTAFPEEHELVRWWLRVMQESATPFQEVLALFWHDHFATSQAILSGDKRYWWQSHLDLFRRGGTGNLRTLLKSLAQDWTMLEWLDGVRSTRSAPNENFARELWELFTLGVDNGYTQADIQQAAKCFTGFRTRFDDVTQQSFVTFDANRHNTTNKNVFGQTVTGRTGADGAYEYGDMVDLTLAQRPVAEYFCKKLLAHFCFANPPQTLVDQLAALLRSSGYELAPVLSALLKSEAFYSATAKAGLVKSPVDLALGFVRATGMRTHMDDLDLGLESAGQRPTMPPNVNGWPGGTLWLSAQAMVERANYVRQCVVHRGTDVQTGLDLRALLPAGGQTTAPAAVDALAALLRVTLSASDRTACITYLDTQRQSSGAVVASPFNAANDTHIDERVRGLLYVLAQHPTYHVR
jgi:uncharacterized protein (DUF1800 family)